MRQIVIFFLNPRKINDLDGLSQAISLPDDVYFLLTSQNIIKVQRAEKWDYSSFDYDKATENCKCILFNDGIKLSEDESNLLIKTLKDIIKDETKLYVVFHKTSDYERKHYNPLKKHFKKQLQNYIAEHEEQHSVFGKYLIPLLENYKEEKFQALIDHISFSTFEYIWKELSLLKLKIKRGNISQPSYKNEIKSIKEDIEKKHNSKDVNINFSTLGKVNIEENIKAYDKAMEDFWREYFDIF